MVSQKFSQTNDRQVIVNRAVRAVNADIDLRSAKRSATLSPNLFSEVYRYVAPTDIRGEKLIDLRRQTKRSSHEKWTLVDDVNFDRFKGIVPYRVALRDENGLKLLRADGVEGDKKKVLHECQSLTTNGTVTASADASNLTIDTANHISGGSSINFDMAKGAATGVVTFTDIDDVDLSDYEDKGSVFAWVFIPDYSDAQAETVTNFILRVGNDSSNYVHRTITTNNEGQTFYDGWNLLRFDLNGATEVGTVTWTAIDYLVLTVTKDTALEADTDWRVDSIVARIGELYDSVYYTKFGWTDTNGTYIEESTAATDLVVADTDEVEIIATKAAEYAAQELKDYDDMKIHRANYVDMKTDYQSNNPSEALKKRKTYGSAPRTRRF